MQSSIPATKLAVLEHGGNIPPVLGKYRNSSTPSWHDYINVDKPTSPVLTMRPSNKEFSLQIER